MRISKEAQKLLDRREKLAVELMEVSHKLDLWLEENGADLTDPDLTDSTITGCMIYAEPWSARKNVEEYIRNKM